MEHKERKQKPTVQLPHLGWFLLSEEERRLLRKYATLALSSQTVPECHEAD
jgi:hypothetical protein